MTYNPNNLISYLTEQVDYISHQVIPNKQVKFTIVHKETTSDKIIFEFNYPRPRKNSKLKNTIIFNLSGELYKKLHKLTEVLYKGTNGNYQLELTQDYLRQYNNYTRKYETYDLNADIYGNMLCICFNYKKVYNTYLSIIPIELLTIIMDKLDGMSLKNLYHSNITTYSLSNEYNYNVLIKMYNPRLYEDILDLNKTFKNSVILDEHLYIKLKGYNLTDFYKNTRDTHSLITETNYGKDDILNWDTAKLNINERPMYSDKREINIIKIILLSIKIKFLFPLFYTKLLSFHLGYTNDLNDWLNTIQSIYNLIFYEKHIKIFQRLMNGYTAVRNYPVVQDIGGVLGDTNFEFTNSPILLWFYLNLNNVHLRYNPSFKLDSLYFSIINALNLRVPSEEYLKIIDNELLLKVLDMINNNTDVLMKKYYIKIYNLNILYDILLEESKKRGL
jgi:hypothetical protein